MSWEEIFQPGLRHWREFLDWQDDKILEEPAPGDKDHDISVDLANMTITIRNNDNSPLSDEGAPGAEPGKDLGEESTSLP